MDNPLVGRLGQGMCRAQIEAMRFMRPELYGALLSEFQGKDREACVARLREMADERGIDLDRMAMQYGIRL